MRIELLPPAKEILEAYEKIDIGFEIRSRVQIGPLRNSGGDAIIASPEPARWKDYDWCEEDRPTVLPSRWNTEHWTVVAAKVGGEWLGGAIVARDTPEMELLGNRRDLALIMDVRVRPDVRGTGTGRSLFAAAAQWAKDRGCVEVRVETQDTNEAACRFYRAMGCSLHSVDEHGYEGIDEAKIIWRVAV